jgi:succinyl-CoA synthetase beta subunit
MASLDEITDAGMSGACFLDMGGTDDPASVENAIALASDKKLLPGMKCVLVCVFGGITRCDVVADGIVAALRKKELSSPLIIRLRGVNEVQGRKVLNDAGIEAHLKITDAVEAVKQVVRP